MIIDNHNLTEKVFIIAELSANHNGDIQTAKQAIRLAKESGADAIKLQTYTADTITLNIRNDHFKAGDIWSNEYLYDLYSRAYMPWEWHEPLKAYADEIGITLFSSPFDPSAVDLLESLNVTAYKIASFEITDIPLIRYTAEKNKPIIISTGIAELEDIALAIKTCHEADNNQIILLKCTSAYPAQDEDMNLRTITDLAERFGCMVGLSDHSLGVEACIASVALGARVIEKHFTPDKSLDTPDREFSLDPHEFSSMVNAVRRVEAMMGKVSYTPKSKRFSRSLFATHPIHKGELFTSENIRSVRPGHGLHPKYLPLLLSKVSPKNFEAGEPITLTQEWLDEL